MNAKAPQYVHGLVRLALENERFLESSPQECWDFVERARRFLLDNWTRFDQSPVKVVQKNKKHFRVSVTKHVDFWNRLEIGRWEPNTFKILDSFISAERYYLDIGSWIGPTALYGAQSAKHTYAFEPDPIAYRELEANIHANENTEWVSRMTIHKKAIASSSGRMKLGSRGAGGDSTSSALFSGGNTNWEVEAITLEEFVEAEELQDAKLFIKIDIEGLEYEVMPGLREALGRYDVDLHLSIHPPFLLASLLPGGRNGIGTRILRRLLFVWHQIRLVRSLPFRYLYHSNGREVNVAKEILKAVLVARFVDEVVATNKRWDGA